MSDHSRHTFWQGSFQSKSNAAAKSAISQQSLFKDNQAGGGVYEVALQGAGWEISKPSVMWMKSEVMPIRLDDREAPPASFGFNLQATMGLWKPELRLMIMIIGKEQESSIAGCRRVLRKPGCSNGYKEA